MNELNALNNEYTELLKSLNSGANTKPLRKSRQMNANDRSSEIRDREIENNNVLIYKLRGESELLYRRISAVGNGKAEHDCTIIDIKEKILKTKQKIKELKLRSR
jgi:mRNA-degrading endonuclease YafQ of YafQ-DinJ toxin-antitoxin module